MASHYSQRSPMRNKQGLHYNGFSAVIHRRGQESQSLACAESVKTGKIEGESAKLG
jgi:hypothetical protein